MPLFRSRLRVLRGLRAEREWSQAKLAAQVGKIARAFGKQIAEVFIYEDI